MWSNTGKAEPECSEQNLIHCHVANGNNVQKRSASTHRQCAIHLKRREAQTQQDSDISKKMQILKVQTSSAVYGINRTLGESRTKYKYTKWINLM